MSEATHAHSTPFARLEEFAADVRFFVEIYDTVDRVMEVLKAWTDPKWADHFVVETGALDYTRERIVIAFMERDERRAAGAGR